jgi:2-dehydro-3-deoxyglucarate aldolase/4-hydroxy-2-oxoheptanedioate aldolase
VSLGHPRVAEIVALAGYDFVIVDVEHTPMSLETLDDVVRAIELRGVPTVVRVPWNDPVELKRVLDIGVAGVMIPMVETAAAAEEAVDAMTYPPDGVRGVAGSRATSYGLEFAEYLERADDDLVAILQIETLPGVENAAEISRVEGVDSLFVGPSDLSASLGVAGDWDDEAVLEAIDDVLGASEVPVGSLAVTEEGIEQWVERGFDWVIAGVDSRNLLAGSQSTNEAFERAVERRDG